MSPFWRRSKPRAEHPEVDIAVQANDLARAEAQAAREQSRALAQRVARIHAVLLHEGAVNGFTQRWEQQMRGSA